MAMTGVPQAHPVSWGERGGVLQEFAAVLNPTGPWFLATLGLQASGDCPLLLVGARAPSFTVPCRQLLPDVVGLRAPALPAPLPLLSKGAPAHSALLSFAILTKRARL